MRFHDRAAAGWKLASRLTSFANRHDVVVLALPRGGVPVAFEVARALKAPLDVFLVRKLGVPGHPELAMGAIASGGVRVLSEDLIDELGIPRAAVEQVAVRERLELERRERLYRGDRRLPMLRDRTVILIDDGLATGSTMEAAIAAVKQYQPARVVVASPVGAPETCHRLHALADDVICLDTPDQFQAVGLWYERFDQTSDEEVIDLLRRASTASRHELARPDAELAPSERRSLGAAAGGAGAADGAGGASGVGGGSSGPTVLQIIRGHAQALTGDAHDYDALLNAVWDARLVLIGEGSHGTHEFYRERAFITERLISERGFAAVAVEADLPEAHRVNQYVRGASGDPDAVAPAPRFYR